MQYILGRQGYAGIVKRGACAGGREYGGERAEGGAEATGINQN
jgi:hypothetical protein